MRILDRYIATSVIWATGLVVLVLVGMSSFIAFITELPSIGVGHYGILSVFAYVGLQMPSQGYQLFPVAGFLGSLIGLGRLAGTSELIIMRAAGISISRIAWAVVKAASLMLVIVTLVGEWPALTWQYQAMQLKEKQIQHKIDPWSTQDLWLHRGNTFVHVGAILSNTEIQDVERFDFDSQNHLLSSSFAERGLLKNGVWQLQRVSATALTPERTTVTFDEERPLGFTFQPDLGKKKIQKDSSQQTMVGLWRDIQYRRQAGLLSNELESIFWTRLLQPLTTVLMICLGVPFIFGSLRSASMSARMLTGIIVGFIFYMLNQFLGPIALLYQWPGWIAGALPTLFFFLMYGIFLSRTRC